MNCLIIFMGSFICIATTPDGSIKKLTRGKSSPAALLQGEPKTPTGYDWCSPSI